MKRLKLQIPHLTCACCVPDIEQVMRQQAGVIWATISFAAGEATVIYDPAAFKTLQFMQVMNRLGYQVTLDPESTRHSQTIPNNFKPWARMQQWVQAFSRERLVSHDSWLEYEQTSRLE